MFKASEPTSSTHNIFSDNNDYLAKESSLTSFWNQRTVKITLGISAASLLVVCAVVAAMLSHYGTFGEGAQHFIDKGMLNWIQSSGIALGVGAGVGLIAVGTVSAIIIKKKRNQARSTSHGVSTKTKVIIIAVSILLMLGALGAGLASHYGIFGESAKKLMQHQIEPFFVHTLPHFTLQTLPNFTMKTALPWLKDHSIALGLGSGVGSMIAGVLAYKIYNKKNSTEELCNEILGTDL